MRRRRLLFRRGAPEREEAADEAAAEAQARFLEDLQHRVGWQVEAAYSEPERQASESPAAEAEGAPVPRTLAELERLVAERSAAEPERAEELRWYLFYLREQVGADELIPPEFDLLLQQVFGPGS